MKQLVFVCLIFTALFASIDERITDIYFGNGVWNDEDDAKKSRIKLEDIILKSIYNNDAEEMYKNHAFKVAYNLGQGYMTDTLETYYQLRESGQINAFTGLFTLLALFKGNVPLTGAAAALYEATKDKLASWEEGNVDDMWDKYYEESFSKGHRVLLVSHSQGNLFANRIYDKINPKGYQDYFLNVAVATPADKVPKSGPYITNLLDYVIVGIPGSLPGNNPGFGHGFIGAYLENDGARISLLDYVDTFIGTLRDERSQWSRTSQDKFNTCEHTIEITHDFDSGSVQNIQKVLPYDEGTNGLVFQVPEENSTNILYVKGNIDGQRVHILVNDDNRTLCEKVSQDLECSELQGTGQKILAQFTPPTYEILEDLNPKECTHRLTLKNTETNQTITDIYPFATSQSNAFIYNLLNENNDSVTVFTNSCDATAVKSKTEFVYDCFELENTNEEITKEVIIDDIKAFDIVKNGSINETKHQQYRYSSSATSNPNDLDAHFYYNNWCLADNSEEKIKAKLRDYTGNYIGAPGRLSSPLVDEFTNLFTFISNEGRYYYVNGSIPTSTSSSSPRRDLSFTSEDINTFLPQGDFKLKEENLLWTNRDSVHDVDQNKYMGHTDLFCSENKKALFIDFDYQTLFYYRDVANSSLIFQHEATPKY